MPTLKHDGVLHRRIRGRLRESQRSYLRVRDLVVIPGLRNAVDENIELLHDND